MYLLLRIILTVSGALSAAAWAQKPSAPSAQMVEQKSADQLAVELLRDTAAYQAVVGAAHQGHEKALSAINKAFSRATDLTVKSNLAIVLLQNGPATDEIVDHVSEPALRVISANIPFPYRFDSQGEILKGNFSEEFLSWCSSRNVEPKQGAQQAIVDDPASVSLLGSARHPSVVPTLMKVLELRNYISVSNAAMALAQMQD